QAEVLRSEAAVGAAAPEAPELYYENFSEGRSGEAGLTQALPISNWTSAARAAASADAEAARLEAGLIRAAVTAEARKLFYAVSISAERLRFETGNSAAALELLGKVEERVLSGRLGSADLLRARLESERARLREYEASAALKKLKSSLNLLMGRDPSAPLAIEEDPAAFDIAETDWKPFDASARLDLRLLEKRAGASALRVKAERRRRALPDLAAGAAMAREDGAKGLKFSLGMRLPLWGPASSAVRSAESDREAAAAELTAAGIRAAHEFNIARVSADAARERARVLRGNLDTVHELRRLASLAYLSGRAQLTDYYEAHRVFLEGNLEYLEAMRDYQWAKADLEKCYEAPLAAGEEQ
ncbi:MAG TPA: TolC family protein, partial [Elusimicrobiales bacterium]|nr:TolC family protein [Elusimicrobiales bacterium]